jgi:hypothetical protein
MSAEAEQGHLFVVAPAPPAAPEPAVTPPPAPGAVATTFARLVDAGREAGTLVDEDAALIEGVRVLAEALDTAHRLGGMKGGYLAVQALPPYQRGLHALRLPVELTAVSQPAPAPEGHTDTPSWVRDAFGSAE